MEALPQRAREAIGAILKTDVGEVAYVQITPLEPDNMRRKTLPPAWTATKWPARKYGRMRPWDIVGAITSIYSCSAPDINRSALQEACVFHFAGLASRLELGIQVLGHIGWSPERAGAHRMNAGMLLPPSVGAQAIVLGRRFQPEEVKDMRPRGLHLPNKSKHGSGVAGQSGAHYLRSQERGLPNTPQCP